MRETVPAYCPGVCERRNKPRVWVVTVRDERDEEGKNTYIASTKSRDKAIKIRDR
jgi:hypothetical protein